MLIEDLNFPITDRSYVIARYDQVAITIIANKRYQV